jgi:hypothetical protein
MILSESEITIRYLKKGDFFGLLLSRKTKLSLNPEFSSLSLKYSFEVSLPIISKLRIFLHFILSLSERLKDKSIFLTIGLTSYIKNKFHFQHYPFFCFVLFGFY